MKTPFYKSPRAHKWGLFCVLAGALVFDLSINPQTQHFTADFASTAETSETVKVKVDDNTYEFVTDKQDGKVQGAHFVNNGTAADNGLCPTLCGKLIDLKDISNIEDVLKFKVKEAQQESKDKPSEVAATDEKPAPKKIQKEGHFTEFSSDDADAWAEKCADKSKDNRLQCQAKQLIALSKHMENSDDQDIQNAIASYFTKYVQPGMNAKYKSPVMKLIDGSYERNDDALDEMDDLSSTILAGLRDENGAKTREMLSKMIAKSYSEQIKHGQNMIREGEQSSNVMEIYAGMNNLNPNYWNQRLADQTDTLTSSGDDTIDDLINKNLSTPVESMLNQMAASGQRALSQNSQIAKMSNGYASPCISFCQGYLNFNSDSGGMMMNGPNGLGQVVGSTRSFGRGSAISQAPWFNNTSTGTMNQFGQNSQLGGLPGSYQQPYQQPYQQTIGQQPFGSGYQQSTIMQPGYQQPMIQQPGVQNYNPGYSTGAIRSAGGRIQ